MSAPASARAWWRYAGRRTGRPATGRRPALPSSAAARRCAGERPGARCGKRCRPGVPRNRFAPVARVPLAGEVSQSRFAYDGAGPAGAALKRRAGPAVFEDATTSGWRRSAPRDRARRRRSDARTHPRGGADGGRRRHVDGGVERGVTPAGGPVGGPGPGQPATGIYAAAPGAVPAAHVPAAAALPAATRVPAAPPQYQQQPAYAQPAPASAPGGAPPAGDDMDSRLLQLRQLGELKAQGILTQEEFEAQKRKILGA